MWAQGARSLAVAAGTHVHKRDDDSEVVGIWVSQFKRAA